MASVNHTRWQPRVLYKNTNNTRASTHTHKRARIHTHTRTHAHTSARTHIHIRTRVCTHTHTHTHTLTHVSGEGGLAHTHAHTHTHTHTHTYLYLSIYIHAHTHTHTHTHTHIYIYLYIYTHARTHTHTRARAYRGTGERGTAVKQQKLKRKICLEIVIEQVRSGDGLETGRISGDREFLFSLMALVQIDCMVCCGISGRRSQISRGHHHHPLKKVLGRARLVSRGPPAVAILSRPSGIRSGETHSRDFSCSGAVSVWIEFVSLTWVCGLIYM